MLDNPNQVLEVLAADGMEATVKEWSWHGIRVWRCELSGNGVCIMGKPFAFRARAIYSSAAEWKRMRNDTLHKQQYGQPEALAFWGGSGGHVFW